MPVGFEPGSDADHEFRGKRADRYAAFVFDREEGGEMAALHFETFVIDQRLRFSLHLFPDAAESRAEGEKALFSDVAKSTANM